MPIDVEPCAVREVALVHWPAQAEERSERGSAGRRSLLVIERGRPIPPLGPDEDFVWADADEQEVADRLHALRRRPAGEVSAAFVLPEGLTPDQHRVASRLALDLGALVRREDLPVDDVDAVIEALREPLASIGCTAVRIADVGYVLVGPREVAS